METVALLGLSLAIALAALNLEDSELEAGLKVFVILVASLLPAYLFVRFLGFRASTLWDEYVLNLHRLEMDHPVHLPPPPTNSIYYPRWADATVGQRREGTAERREPTIYQQKFEAHYGHIVTPEMAWRDRPHGSGVQPQAEIKVRGMVPVMLLTAMLAVGWSILLRDDLLLADPGRELGDALQFGFLGAYAFILQMLLRRFFQSDLKASAYTAGAVRVITVLILVTVLHGVWSDSSDGTQAALAFTVGFFPLVGMQALTSMAKTVLRVPVRSLRTDYPLSDLDGLNIWYEARLLEEGIEDMQNLASANLVDVILHTRVPVGRLVDWIDQAHLYLHVAPAKDPDGSSRRKLRRLGIRTATDLEAAFKNGTDCHGWLSAEDDDALREGLRWVLNEKPGEGPSTTQSILKTFENDTNLFHVKKWKANWAECPQGDSSQPHMTASPAN
ncbi:MAG TPA: hypothetical protein VHH09_07990 [Acidimicrobiales bacterium]|nr:hypothetical protein [Acidimicrobiales bacterium]